MNAGATDRRGAAVERTTPARKSRAARAYELLRTRGVREGSGELGAKLWASLHKKEAFLVLEKTLAASGSAAGRQRSETGIWVKDSTPDELRRFPIPRGGERKGRELIERYLGKGYRCFLGFEGSEPIGYFWWIGASPRGRAAHSQLELFEIDLGESDVWGFDYFVRPEYRGRGRANELLEKIEQELGNRGYKRLLGYVDADNIGARWLYERRGHRLVGALTVRTLLGGAVAVSTGRLFVKGRRWPGPAAAVSGILGRRAARPTRG
jgi:GNAT superfamily N-acetyltransferase